VATRKIAPTLAAGCTVVVKPAELTPLSALLFCQLLTDAGVPAGVVNVVTTSSPASLAARLISDHRLRKLSFTGSTPVGRKLMAQAADNVLRTSMELGGNAPFLVFADADLDAAVEGAMLAKFRNIGQACTAANSFLVQRPVADEFAWKITERVSALVVGNGMRPDVTVGPLVEDRAVDSVDRLVRDAVQRGASVRTGGRPLEGPGSFSRPPCSPASRAAAPCCARRSSARCWPSCRSTPWPTTYTPGRTWPGCVRPGRRRSAGSATGWVTTAAPKGLTWRTRHADRHGLAGGWDGRAGPPVLTSGRCDSPPQARAPAHGLPPWHASPVGEP